MRIASKNSEDTQVQTQEARLVAAYKRGKLLAPSLRYSDSNPRTLPLEQELERCLLARLRQSGRAPLHDKEILEVGCGNGHQLQNLIRWGAQPEKLFGIDLLARRILEAGRSLPKSVTLSSGSATRLDFANERFDLVFQFTVFSSILDSNVKQAVAREMLRVLKPGGCVVWYDFHVDNPRNPDVRGVKKTEIRQLFPECRFEFDRITLTPPLARAVAPFSWALCRWLSAVKIFSTHYLALVTKPSQS